MGTIYNIPVRWEKDVNSNKESYNGKINLTYGTGNEIVGMWGQITGHGVSMDDGQTMYWNQLTISGQFIQGEEVKKIIYDSPGKYYPSREYNYYVNIDTPLIRADKYSVSLKDDTYIYDRNTMTVPDTIPLDVSAIRVEQPKNFTVSSQEIYNDITITFDMVSSNRVDYQVTQSNKVIIEKNNSTAKKILIPAGTIKSTNTVTIKVRTHFNFYGNEHYSDWATYTLSNLKGLKAETPSNVRLVGDQKNIEEDITFAWDTEDTRCTSLVEVWQDGEMLTSKSGISNKQYVLPAGTLRNTNDIRVRVNNTLSVNGYSNTSGYAELQVDGLKSVKPIITDFTLGSNNRDYEISVTVMGSNCDSFKIYANDKEISSSTSSTLTISEGTLLKGRNSVTVKGIKLSSTGELVGELTKEFDIVQDEPIIYSIEPSNININVEEVSTVSFNTNTFISRWELYINGYLHESGTSGREVSVSARTFNSGENTLKVNAYYSPLHNASDIRSSSKTVTFTGYGRPKDPVHDGKYVYDTATPTFTWTTGTGENDSQTAFEIEVNEEKKLVNGSTKEYTVSEPLADDKHYTVRLRIKNKFEMWSNWVEKEFDTSFLDLPKPVITVSPQLENVLIEVQADELAGLTKVSVFRSNDAKKWVELANDLNPVDTLIDFMVQSNVKTYYKVRVYDSLGGFNESEIKSITVNIRNYNILDVTDLRSNKRLDFATINFTNNFTSVTKIFSNSTRPVFYKGNTSFYTASMTVKLENKDVDEFINYIKNGDIFCYRDYRGKKIFVAIDIMSITYINPFLQELVLSLTEINFNEKLSANKNNCNTLVYLNGQYYLYGSLDLSGLRC